MKKIDNILNGTDNQYPSLISKLSTVLEPFALVVTGKLPIYMGNIPESVELKVCKDCGRHIFCLNGNDLAAVDVQNMTASVFGGEFFPLQTEDFLSIKNLLGKLEEKEEVDPDRERVREILKNMPPEVRKMMVLASLLRTITGSDED